MPAKASRKHYLTLAESADYLNVSEKTVRRLIASGDLRAYRIAGRRRTIRLAMDELEASMQPIPAAGGAA